MCEFIKGIACVATGAVVISLLFGEHYFIDEYGNVLCYWAGPFYSKNAVVTVIKPFN